MKDNFGMDFLSFDIETAPIQLDALSEIKREELEQRHPLVDNEETPERKLFRGVSPWYAKIVSIGIYYESGGKEIINAPLYKGDEHQLLYDFFNILSKMPQHITYVSFNGKNFDVPFITLRSALYEDVVPDARFLNIRKFDNLPHYDIRDVLSKNDRYGVGNLRIACDHFGIPSPKEEGITASEVGKAFYEGRVQEIASYCQRDTYATAQLFKKVVRYYPITPAKIF
jgi:predicted PolB exonuclease-like 3'-5' exonuclease